MTNLLTELRDAHRDDQEFVHALSRLEIMLRGEATRRED